MTSAFNFAAVRHSGKRYGPMTQSPRIPAHTLRDALCLAYDVRFNVSICPEAKSSSPTTGLLIVRLVT
jgi:hypothetical protein